MYKRTHTRRKELLTISNFLIMRQEDWVLYAIKTIQMPYFIALYNSR